MFFIIVIDNILGECGKTWSFPRNILLMRKKKDLWLDLKINKGAWNMGAGNNVAEGKILKKYEWEQGMVLNLWFNNKMIFGHVDCQKISLHPALCLSSGRFVPCLAVAVSDN